MVKIMVQYGRARNSSRTESVKSSFDMTIMGKANWENPIETWLRENSKFGMSLCASLQSVVLICVCGWHKIDWKETKSWSDVETTQLRSRFGRTSIFLGSCILALHSTTIRNKQRYCEQLQNHVWIANFRVETREIVFSFNIFVFLHGLMTWLVMKRNLWSDIVSWQTKRLNNFLKYVLHASLTTTSKKKKRNLVVNCQMYALKF